MAAADNEKQLICGNPDEWKDFHKRHSLFFERFSNLRDAIATAFLRRGSSAEAIDRFIFLYGRLCCEDFQEVLLCCGNGYGFAALKLVRSLYERAVTIRYLHEHPDELTAFLDFHNVQAYKLLIPVEETFGKVVSQEVSDEVKAKYREVKEDFMVTVCDKCKTKRVNHTWNKLDFVSLAKKSGTIGKLLVPGYFLPLRHAHATLGSLMSRLEYTPEDGMSFIPTAQRDDADQALMVAHNIIIEVLRVQQERFSVPGLEDKTQVCARDFLEIYKKEKRSPSKSRKLRRSGKGRRSY